MPPRPRALDDVKVLAAALGFLAATCAGVLLCAWRRQGRKLGPYSRAARWSAAFAGVASATWLASLVSFGLALGQLGADPFKAIPAYPNGVLRVAVGLAYAASLVSVGGAALFVVALRGSGWTVGRRVRHALVLAAMICAAALLVRWNVLLAP